MDHGGGVEHLPRDLQRQPDDEHPAERAVLHQLRERPLGGVEEGVLLEQVGTRVPGQRQLREDEDVDAGRLRVAQRLAVPEEVERRVRDPDDGRGGGDADKLVEHDDLRGCIVQNADWRQ